jgi:hypothetical protein
MSRYSSSSEVPAQPQKEEAAEQERPGRLQPEGSRQGSTSQRSDDGSSDPWVGEAPRPPAAASVQLPDAAEQLSASQEERGDLPLRAHVQHTELRPEGWDHP